MSDKETTSACPECGETEFERGEWREGNHEHICTACGQSWFPDIDYDRPVHSDASPEDVRKLHEARGRWRVDIDGQTVYVIGKAAHDHLNSVKMKLIRMKHALAMRGEIAND